MAEREKLPFTAWELFVIEHALYDYMSAAGTKMNKFTREHMAKLIERINQADGEHDGKR